MRRAPPRRESAPYFVGPRCVFVCVCVCLCVYSRVGASYVGRPICVCAVSAPLRRVNTYNLEVLVHGNPGDLVLGNPRNRAGACWAERACRVKCAGRISCEALAILPRCASSSRSSSRSAAAAAQPQQQRSSSAAAAAAAASVCSHRACSWSRAVSAHTFRSNPHTKRKISIRFNITVRHVQDQLAKVIPLDGPMVLMVGSWRSKLFIQYHSIQQLVRRHNRKCNSAIRAHMVHPRKSGARTCVVCVASQTQTIDSHTS
jgi:hypothetical protein